MKKIIILFISLSILLTGCNKKENITAFVKEGTLTRESLTIVINTKNDANSYLYGSCGPRLEKKTNNEWIKVNTIDNIEIGCIEPSLKPENNTLEIPIDLKTAYGTLENGTYRLEENAYQNNKVVETFYIEFEIKG